MFRPSLDLILLLHLRPPPKRTPHGENPSSPREDLTASLTPARRQAFRETSLKLSRGRSLWQLRIRRTRHCLLFEGSGGSEGMTLIPKHEHKRDHNKRLACHSFSAGTCLCSIPSKADGVKCACASNHNRAVQASTELSGKWFVCVRVMGTRQEQ